jgi:hemerythrin superfamily protein
MKATDLLEKHHRELERIFDRIRAGEAPLQNVVTELADTLVAHQIIEEQIFYPHVRKALAGKVPINERPDILLQCIEEHALATIALRRLLATEPDERAFAARVTVLRDLWLSHVAEEEEELFPQVIEVLDEEAQLHMGHQLEELFEATKSRGHGPILAGEESRRSKPRIRLNGRGRTAVH